MKSTQKDLVFSQRRGEWGSAERLSRGEEGAVALSPHLQIRREKEGFDVSRGHEGSRRG